MDPGGSGFILKSERSDASPSMHKVIHVKMKKDKNGYPEADKVMKNGILLACHHGLTNKMIKHIHNSIDQFINKKTN